MRPSVGRAHGRGVPQRRRSRDSRRCPRTGPQPAGTAVPTLATGATIPVPVVAARRAWRTVELCWHVETDTIAASRSVTATTADFAGLRSAHTGPVLVDRTASDSSESASATAEITMLRAQAGAVVRELRDGIAAARSRVEAFTAVRRPMPDCDPAGRCARDHRRRDSNGRQGYLLSVSCDGSFGLGCLDVSSTGRGWASKTARMRLAVVTDGGRAPAGSLPAAIRALASLVSAVWNSRADGRRPR